MSIDKQKVIQAINDSGFPLELKVAQIFKERGYSIQPSKIIHDKEKEKDYEVDLIASNKQVIEHSGKKLLTIAQIAVECKDYHLPYVFMGVDNIKSPEKGFFDPDSYYCHIESSRDGKLPNKFALTIFDSEYGGQELKKNHHHFTDELYFHSATALEEKGKGDNKYYKLHTPNIILHPVSKLGGFVGDFHGYGKSSDMKYNEMMEEVNKMPVLRICFLMYVHTSDQFQYDHNRQELKSSNHTPVRFNRSYCNESINYIIDFVNLNKLNDAINTIDSSFSKMSSYLLKWIYA